MALTNEFDSTFPPTGLAPYRIYDGWCLGDSLPYINANSRYFDTGLINASTALAAASATLNTTVASTSSTIITTLSTVPYARLNDGNQSGVAPIFGARAWVSFDSTNRYTVGPETLCTIRGQGNVSKVVYIVAGVFEIYFSVPMTDSNYSVSTIGTIGSYGDGGAFLWWDTGQPNGKLPTTTSFRVALRDRTGGLYNSAYVNVIAFR